MHETDDRKRWLDLFDDLGLPPESQSAPPSPVIKAAPLPTAPLPEEVQPSAPAVVEPVAEVVPEEAPAPRTRRKKATPVAVPEGEIEKEPASRVRRKRRVAKPDEAAVETPAPTEEPAVLHVAAEQVAIESEPVVPEPIAFEPPTTLLEEPETELVEPLVDDGAVAPNGEDPVKGPRRRRRRRRRKPSDAAEDVAVQPVVAGQAMAEEPLEDSEDESGTVFASETGSDEEDEEASETPAALEDEIEFEDLTNLDMPSWAELVGSLYRPPDR